MGKTLSAFFDRVEAEIDRSGFSISVSEEGKVISTGDGIIKVSGLRDAKFYELIELENGDSGIVFDLDAEKLGAVLLTEKNGIKAGDKVYKTDRIASVNVGDELFGRILNALGKPIDEGPRPERLVSYRIERLAPMLVMRDFVSEPLYTGIKAIDAMFPIGRGQRELIIGDPSTGKTAIGIDTIINQKNSDVISIYVVIGHNKSHVSKVIEELKRHGDFSRIIIVVADASESLGLQYIAPYSATAIAEYFMDRGKDVLIVYDDLTKHAEAYRSLSLLLRRPPGREAYPGDIFFIHSRLLERSSKLSKEYGGGSITSLPIVETQQGRISSFIPTNLISITDGQIYLDLALFNNGIRPAIDVGRSVSRIGGKAQVEAMKEVAQRLKIDFSRFMEVEVFTKFGAHLEEETASLIRRGERLREILKQPRFHPFSAGEEVVSFMILESGVLDKVELTSVLSICHRLLDKVCRKFPEVINLINQGERLSMEDRKRILALITDEESE